MEPPRAHQTSSIQTPPASKWKTVIALILLLVAIILNWSWVFGILFITWAIADMAAGRVYFVEEITKSANPVLFWTIVTLWLLLGLYSLLEPFFI
ncbi:MAG: hypothetical protein ETSY1_20735 [Candidatus Entotheonella factor]|uniref:Phosphatidate cytidylyltransferase n=1 Tax=Entotheonella factor TaxID=1429438 RepID=W4LJ72_ENTF1|nr:MAG: hypothetical protein ETSY1_20735 [Candidatus Entotheonella factor]